MSRTSNGGLILAETQRPPTRRGRWARRALVLTLVAALGYAGYAGFRWAFPDLLAADCTATAAGVTHDLTPEQAANASTIAAVSVRRGLPARAATIAIATAMQESKLRNLTVGDRDSVGLFQQRPSQGWGTREQILDPVYSAGAFFDRLVKVGDYTTRPLTEVAQEVQRSAFPEAYAQHEDEARVFASVLTGQSPAGLVCRLDAPTAAGDADRAVALLAKELGASARAGDGGILAVDASGATQWAAAAWFVAHADTLAVTSVQCADRGWSRDEPDVWKPRSGSTGLSVALSSH
jgi:hypothetical protein